MARIRRSGGLAVEAMVWAGCLGLAGLAASAPARAEGVQEVLAHDDGLTRDGGNAAHLTFGRAIDLAGRPVNLSHPAVAVVHFGLPPAEDMSVSTSVSMPSGTPVASASLTSGFGLRRHPILGGIREHSGVDLAISAGSPVHATADGVVERAAWSGGYGLAVSLDNGPGVETRFGHMSRLNVVAGQQVHRGDVIGYVGSTGLSTGPHLHYEVRMNGHAVDPHRFMGHARGHDGSR